MSPLRQQTAGDVGLFGPESVTWRVMGDPAVNMSSSVLQQIGPPPIAQALLDNGGRYEFLARIIRTQTWSEAVVFGTVSEAERACLSMLRAHRRLGEGTIPAAHATFAYPAGSRYEVADPVQLLWVLGSIVDHAAAAYKWLGGRLGPHDEVDFVREWHVVLGLLDIPAVLWWADHHALRAFIEGGLRSWARPGPGALLAIQPILTGGFSNPASRWGWRLLLVPTIALADSSVRDAYGLRLTALEQAFFLTVSALLRLLRKCHALPTAKKAKRRAESRAAATLSQGCDS